MATIYTTSSILAVRQYQAVCCVNTYIQFVCKKATYGSVTTCMQKKMVLLTQWLDIYLRYDNPSNSTEEALNCLTEAQMDSILEQISKATGCSFVAKDGEWVAGTAVSSGAIPWEWNDLVDIHWNDTTTIDLNETE